VRGAAILAALLFGLAGGLGWAQDAPPAPPVPPGGAEATEPAPAPPAAEPLRYRWPELTGWTALYTVETELEQTVIHGGQPPAVGRRWRRDTVEQELRRRGEGGRVHQTTQRIELSVRSPDEAEVRHDTAGPDEPPEGLEQALGALGRTVKLDVDPRGVVTRVRGAQDALQEGAFKASFLVLPEGPLAPGGSWARRPNQEVPYPPFGKLTYRTRYTLEEPQEETWSVVAKTQILFAPGPPPADQPAAQVEVVRQEAGGRMVFDRRGLLVESTFRSVLELKITSGGVTRTERAVSTTLQRMRGLTRTRR
jgi:hypothetical protein